MAAVLTDKKKGPKKGKKSRKIGRNQAKCTRYRTQGRRYKNALKRLKRHTHHYPGDLAAVANLDRLGKTIPSDYVRGNRP